MNTEHKRAINTKIIKSTAHWVTFKCFFEVGTILTLLEVVVPEASEVLTLIAFEEPLSLAFNIGVVHSALEIEKNSAKKRVFVKIWVVSGLESALEKWRFNI